MSTTKTVLLKLRCSSPGAYPVWTKQRGEGGRPTATHHIMAIISALPGLLTATAAPEMTWLPLNVVVVDNDRGASPNGTHIGRARLALVRNRCLQSPPGYMQGGSRCPGRAIERRRARWHDPVLK